MKRIAVLLLVFAMLLSLAACGGKTADKDDRDEDDRDNASQEDTTKEDEDKDDEDKEDEDKDDEGKEDEISFKEMVVVDNEECSIKITGIEPDNMWGYTVKALVENKSADKTYMFAVETAAVNGVQSLPFFAAEVPAGKKSNEGISFADEELEKNGITEYTDIELTFRVYDSNDWEAADVAKETVHIYPYGEDKAVKFVREAQSSDNVIVDNDDVSVVVTGFEEDEFFGYMVKLYLCNKTDKNVVFTAEEAAVNGFMADPIYGETVSAGKSAFSFIAWPDTTFEENGIKEVETIEFKLRVYDNDDWTADDIVTETVTLKP